MKITRTATSPTGTKEDGLNVYLTLKEAKRIRAALSHVDDKELASFDGILEQLRWAIPNQ
jgi:hypothetical protein